MKLYKKKFDANHLRTFVSLCFATDLRYKDKLKSRSIPSIMLGYATIQKEYQLLNIQNRAIFVSRDVIFKEHIFPFTIKRATFLHCNSQHVTDWKYDEDDNTQPHGSIDELPVMESAEVPTVDDQTEQHTDQVQHPDMLPPDSAAPATDSTPAIPRRSTRVSSAPKWSFDYMFQ